MINGIVVKGQELTLVRSNSAMLGDTCYKCALPMQRCNSLCVHFGRMLGYTPAAVSEMYFVKEEEKKYGLHRR